jgi:hypothetical protein
VIGLALLCVVVLFVAARSPFFVTWLIEATGTPIAPAYYLMFGAAVGLLAALLLRERARDAQLLVTDLSNQPPPRSFPRLASDNSPPVCWWKPGHGRTLFLDSLRKIPDGITILKDGIDPLIFEAIRELAEQREYIAKAG